MENDTESVAKNAHGSSFRVASKNYSLFELLENKSGLTPSTKGRKGDPKFSGSNRIFPENIWILKSPLPKENELSSHLDWIWSKIKDHKETILALKEMDGVKIDIFCTYTSDSDHSGLEISPKSLEMLVELGIKFNLSIIA